jgi:presenilin 1
MSGAAEGKEAASEPQRDAPPPPPQIALPRNESSESEADDDGGPDLNFSVRALMSLVGPVSATMLLSVLATVHLAQPGDAEATGVDNYLVSDESSQGSDSDRLRASLVNTLAIVGVVMAVTFLMVCLLYFRLTKAILWLLIFSVIALLFGSGAFVIDRFIDVIGWRIDLFSVYFFLWNLTVGGVITIFKLPNSPIRQGYMVVLCVIMAFLFAASLPEWTIWTLLLALAIYDLCAVLTPCGPLRCLINIAQEREEEIPALLYEAQASRAGAVVAAAGAKPAVAAATQSSPRPASDAALHAPLPQPPLEAGAPRESPRATESEPLNRDYLHLRLSPSSSSPLAERKAPDAAAGTQSGDFTVELLPHAEPKAAAGADAPAGAARAHDRVHRPAHSHPAEERDELREVAERTVRLGLGDFVFYSVLVSRAAQFGFATMAACFLAVIAGLASTLFALAIYRKALPALPFSIASGTVFYFVTREVISPYIDELASRSMFI